MKLNKKECRKSADPCLKLNPRSGIMNASQVDFIVRAAVKVIDRHKTLVLWLYSREQASQGDVRPCIAVFQGRDDFATLEQKEDGSTVWRSASFNCLNSSWDFSSRCAFYDASDSSCFHKYFDSRAETGFIPLIRAQMSIQQQRRREQQIKKEKRIISRMSCISALPRGLKSWIHKTVMPAYFFYDYKRDQKDTPGVCSSCGKAIRLSGVKQGVKKICPHCKKEIICKPRSRRSKYMYDRSTAQVIQNTGNGEIVLRIIKIYYNYNDSDTPEINIYENARYFVHRDAESGRVRIDSFYYAYHSGILTDWKEGERPRSSMFYEGFEPDASGHLYTKNLPDALAGTSWQYCPIADFYNHFRKPFLAPRFLSAYLIHPTLEHLVKTGFYSVVNDLVYSCQESCLDESQHRTHGILGVNAEDIDFLRSIDLDMEELKIYQKYAGLKGRQELIIWQIQNKISRDVLPILKHMTPHKAMRYLDRQFGFLRLRKTKYGTQRYKNMQDLVSEYRDYLELCKKLNYDIKNSFVKYPADLQKAHDKAAHRMKHKADAKERRAFAAVYKRIAGQFDFEQDGMKIVYPSIPDDVIREGHALHHCVGGYTGRVADHECVILFLRQCADESKPFYTIEIRGNKPVQVRGLKNCSATPEVDNFIRIWEQRVLSRIDTAA